MKRTSPNNDCHDSFEVRFVRRPTARSRHGNGRAVGAQNTSKENLPSLKPVIVYKRAVFNAHKLLKRNIFGSLF